MQKELRTFRKKAALLAAAVAGLLALLLLPGRATADAAPNMANLVVFAVGSDDPDDPKQGPDDLEYDLPASRKLHLGAGAIVSAYNSEFVNYFNTVSNGNLRIANVFPQYVGGTAAPFVLSQPVTAYTDSADIVSEVLAKLSQMGVSWTGDYDVDRNDDGLVDNLTVIVQTSAAQTPDSVLYPHKGDAGGLTVGGLTVFSYNVIDSRTMLSHSESSDSLYCNGCDVAAHEFLHTLGLPDLYYYSSDGKPVGEWCVMATGQMYRYPLGFLRANLGWLPAPETVTADGHYTLNAASASSGTRLIKLKTPLSDTQYFLIEYRIKNETMGGIDQKIPSSGLIVYRVDESVPRHTNAQGGNYIYIFRPDNASANDTASATLPHPAYPTGGSANNIANAAILPPGETAYGSTDLAASLMETDLIYYADGSNSGIALSNVALSSDGQSISFDVAFADYTDDDLWQLTGAAGAGTSMSTPALAVHGGTAYVAGMDYMGDTPATWIKKWNGTAWEAVGGSTAGVMYDPQLRSYGGELYLLGSAVEGVNTYAVMYKLSGASWSRQWKDTTANPSALRFVNSETGLYVSYAAGTPQTLYVRDAARNAAVFTGPSAAHFLANPAVCEKDGVFYIAYTDYNGSASDLGYIARYTAAGGLEERIGASGGGGANLHGIAYDGTVLHALFGGSGGKPWLATYRDGAWTQTQIASMPASYTDLQLLVSGGTPYILYTGSQTVYCLRQTDAGFSQFGSTVFTGSSGFSAILSGGTVYVASSAAEVSTVTVRQKAAAAAPAPTPTPTPTGGGSTTTPTPTPTETAGPTPPAGDDYTVRLTPPDGYADTTVWIDGVSYTAAVNGAEYAVALSDGSATNAVLYRYNANGVPVGMYVYRLQYTGSVYTVTPLPKLADLLSYHGFSIRVKGVSGIRFKTGVSTTLRPRLLSASGVDGYRLVEYGTLVMRGANLGTYPLVLGGQRTSSGKAYWTQDGTVSDRIFETKDGRHRFTSVLVKLPATEYRTDFAFRGYCILQKDGQRVTLYGPIMARSIYRIAEQVIASGEFSPTSDAGRYVQSILDNAR